MMDPTTIQILIALVGLLFVGGGSLVGVTVYVIQQIRTVEKTFGLQLEKRDTERSRAIHDLRGEMQQLIAAQAATSSHAITKLEAILERVFVELKPIPVIEKTVNKLESAVERLTQQGSAN